MGKITQTIGMFDEEAHWYTSDGKPMHQVPRADGKGYRNTDLRDAKKLQASGEMLLFPSVTSVTGKWDKGIGLRRWREQIIARAAKETRRTAKMSDKDWFERVLSKAEPELAEGRVFGTLAHDVLEHRLKHGDWPTNAREEHVWAAKRAYAKLESICSKETAIEAIEVVLVNRQYGYGGTCDLIVRRGNWFGFIDWKFKKTKGQAIDVPVEYKMQMPAYAFAKGLEPHKANFSCANIITSSDEPDRESEMFALEGHDEINRQLTRFLRMHWMWCEMADYWPGQRYMAADSGPVAR